MSVLMDDVAAFITKDYNLSRRQIDSKDFKPYWSAVATKFNDPAYKAQLFECPYGNQFTGFSEVYSGHKLDASAAETMRYNPLRTELDKALAAFSASGGGDGGPVDPTSLYIMSSKFWNFCNGNLALYYFYTVLAKFDALKGAVSAMEPGHAFGSDVPPRSISATRKRGSMGAGRDDDGGGMVAPVVIQQSEDQVAASASKRAILAAKAMTAADDAMASLMKKHEEATAALEEYETAGSFVSGCFTHITKKARVEMLETSLKELMARK